MKTLMKRSMYALGVLASMALVPGAAWAQTSGGGGASPGGSGSTPSGFGTAPSSVSTSGGPGTLGTEVPNDSAVAQGYVHSRSRISESDRRLEDGIRQLLADNRRSLDHARETAKSDGAAQDEVAAREIAHFNLLKAAQESGFDVEGAEPGFAATGSAGESADLPSYGAAESSTAMASEESSKESTGSGASSDAQDVPSAGDLVKEARDANRLQLASSLEIAQKALDSVESSSSSDTSSSR